MRQALTRTIVKGAFLAVVRQVPYATHDCRCASFTLFLVKEFGFALALVLCIYN